MRRSAVLLAASVALLTTPDRETEKRTDDRSAGWTDGVDTSTVHPSSQPARSGHSVSAEMRNVHFQIAPGVYLDIARLTGELIPRDTTRPPVLGDKHSFTLHIATAEIAIDTASLTNLLSRHVFAYPGSPLRHLRVSIEEGQLVQRGVLHGLLPFSLRADVSLTDRGLIRLSPKKVKVFGIGVRGLMRFFGLNLEKLAKVDPRRGVRIDGDVFYIDPTAILPPPDTRGRVTSLRVMSSGLSQTFGGPPPGRTAPTGAEPANYMYFSGARLTFGKLTMEGTDLLILDDDPADPFDFFLDRYDDQLVAGYSRNTAAAGLVVRMPDLSDMERPMRLKALP